MKLSNVLSKIRDSQNEKTASASDAPSETAPTKNDVAASGDRLKTALQQAMNTLPVKEAAVANSPVNDLEKIAAEVVNTEHQALIKEAQIYGVASADAFMARLSQYNEAAEKLASQQKTAAPTLQLPEKTAAEDSFEKFAAANPELVKEAADLGYTTAQQQLEKLAEVAYNKAFNDATMAIYKTAHDSFLMGFEETAKLLQNAK